MLKWLWGPMLMGKADRLGTYAAALAYCFVLSLVPFLLVTFAVGLQVTSHLALTDEEYSKSYAKVLTEILPAENPDDTKRIFNAIQASLAPPATDKKASWLKSIAVYITLGFGLYTSFNLMDQIVRTLLFIFDDPRRPHEWNWWVVVKGLFLLVVWMCLLLVISVSAVGTAGLRELLDPFLFKSLSTAVVTAVQITIVIGALFGTFFLTYYMVPARPYRKQYVVEGSLLASTGWILCSLIFASVVPKLLQTSATYAALGSIVGVLLWAQACAWSIIIGACWIVRFSSPRGK